MWLRRVGAALLLVLAASISAPARAAVAQVVEVMVDPASARLEGSSRTSWSDGATVPLQWQLAEGLAVQSVRAGGRDVPFSRQGSWIRLTSSVSEGPLELRFSGELRGPAPPQLSPEGSWLPGEAAWFPMPADAGEIPLTITVTVPAGQRAVLTGTLLEEIVAVDQSRATFRAHPGQPPSLFVGPYEVRERQHGAIRLRTYFHVEAAGLADAFLQDAADHIDRFSRTIGPYPYDGFFMVSSPHPVGLGYAGLTYVSRRILRLPFMRGQSLAHEILHAWWGNAVQVAHGSGNWAEALTTFMADYRGAGTADRERMRREWLRDYAALPASQDYPLSRFESRLHTRDLVVGYGKGAFVFDMLEQRIGTTAFDQAAAMFYQRHRGGTADWAQLRQAFEAASGQPLGGFFSQWIDRPGAPRLALSEVRFGEADVSFTVSQWPGDYALRIPLFVETDEGEQRLVVDQQGREQQFRVPTGGRPRALRVDPQHQVFRQLVAGETAPILRDVTLAEGAQAIVVDAPAAQAAQGVVSAVLPQGTRTDLSAWNRVQPAMIVGLGEPAALAARLGLEPPKLPEGGATAWVWMAPGAPGPTLLIAARDAASLAALVRPLPHYGRDGWLAFRGSSLLERGSWPQGERHALSAAR
jgi:aminopeptidase N